MFTWNWQFDSKLAEGWGAFTLKLFMRLLEDDVRIHSYALLVEGQYLVMQLLVTPTIRFIVSSVL
jgi:hypothetical protein